MRLQKEDLRPAAVSVRVMRTLLSVGVAFCLGAGIVLADFVAEPRPIAYLSRPLIAIFVLSAVIGLVSGFFGRMSAAIATFVVVWVVRPDSALLVFAGGLVVVLIAARLWRGQFMEVGKPVGAAAATFLVAGLIPVVPLMAEDPPADSSPSMIGVPTYLILVDGYPRPDTLAANGVDISPFLDQLEERGFDIYPDATSHHSRTFRTLTHMMSGHPMDKDDDGTPEERRQARESWSLPRGFVQIASPYGPATIPGTRTLNPGGPTIFESVLLQSSILGWVSGDYVMDGMRYQVNRSLDLLASTDEWRVFAHIIAPHLPYLYEGDLPASAPECWPICSLYHPVQDPEQAVERVGLYLKWLNPRLLDSIDSILARNDDAEIVLFSDHGGRFSEDDSEEWHRPFLAARSPTRPKFFAGSPHPSRVLDLIHDG